MCSAFSRARGARFSLALAAPLVAAGCLEYLSPGEIGTPRYFGQARGTVPLNLLPPISDRDGNAYVLYGSTTTPEVNVYVGPSEGGWYSGCSLTEGSARFMHGWVGRAQSRAWYWSG